MIGERWDSPPATSLCVGYEVDVYKSLKLLEFIFSYVQVHDSKQCPLMQELRSCRYHHPNHRAMRSKVQYTNDTKKRAVANNNNNNKLSS